MKLSTGWALLGACAAVFVNASPAPVAAPAVTPRALLRRSDMRTFAWTSETMIGTQISYGPWIYDADTRTWTTSGTYFRRCSVSETCNMYTACSSGYMVASGTSSYCGSGGTTDFCSNNILFKSMGATQTYSWFWCDSAGVTGFTFYEEEPSQPTGLSSRRPASTDASTTSDRSSASSTAGSSRSSSGSASSSSGGPPLPTTSDSGSSTNVGAIAGGVVGGIAVLAAIAVGVFFLLRRKKNKTGTPPPAGYAPPADQGPFRPPAYQTPNLAYATPYGVAEAKPVGVAEGNYYTPNTYPQGPYDPHMAYMGQSPSSPPPAEMAGQSPPGIVPGHATSNVPLQSMSPPPQELGSGPTPGSPTGHASPPK